MATKQGFLTKEGSFLRNWKRRWFTLAGAYLLYFESEQSSRPLGSIALVDVMAITTAASERPDHQNCLLLRTAERSFYAYADTYDEMESWILAIGRAVAHTVALRQGGTDNDDDAAAAAAAADDDDDDGCDHDDADDDARGSPTPTAPRPKPSSRALPLSASSRSSSPRESAALGGSGSSGALAGLGEAANSAPVAKVNSAASFFREFQGASAAGKRDRSMFDLGVRIAGLPDEDRELQASVLEDPASSIAALAPRGSAFNEDSSDSDEFAEYDSDSDQDASTKSGGSSGQSSALNSAHNSSGQIPFTLGDGVRLQRGRLNAPSDDDNEDDDDDSETRQSRRQQRRLARQKANRDLYVQCLFAIRHRVGAVNDPECVTAKLFDYCQRVFGYDAATHRSAMEEAAQLTLDSPATSKKSHHHHRHSHSSIATPLTVLRVSIIQARGLFPKDKTGKSDPFCVLGLCDSEDAAKPHKPRYSTSVKGQTLDPVWNEEFVLELKSAEHQVFALDMWDQDEKSALSRLTKQKHDFMGRIRIPIKDISAGGSDAWYTLNQRSKRSNISGDIRIRFNFEIPGAGGNSSGSNSGSSTPGTGDTSSPLPLNISAFRGTAAARSDSLSPRTSVTQLSANNIRRLLVLTRKFMQFEARPYLAKSVAELDNGRDRWSAVLSLQASCVLNQVALQSGIVSTYDRLCVELVSYSRMFMQYCLDFRPVLGVLSRIEELLEQTAPNALVASENATALNSQRNLRPPLQASATTPQTSVFSLSGEHTAMAARAVKRIVSRLIATLLRLRDVFPFDLEESGGSGSQGTSSSLTSSTNSLPASPQHSFTVAQRLQATLQILQTIYRLPLWLEYHSTSSFEQVLPDLLQRHLGVMYRRLSAMAGAMERGTKDECAKLAIIAGAVSSELQYASTHYQRIFAPFGCNLLLLFAQHYCSLLNSDLTAVMRVVADDAKPSELVARPQVFELYFVLKRLRDALSRKFSQSERSTISLIYSFHTHFRASLLRWIELTSNKAEVWILNVISQDNTETVGHALYSSSVIDMFTLFDQIFGFLRSLEWPDPAEESVVLPLLVDIVFKGVKMYCSEVRRNLDRRTNYSPGGERLTNSPSAGEAADRRSSLWFFSGSSSSDRTTSFDVSRQLCILLNNIEHADTRLKDLFLSLETSGVVDTAASALRSSHDSLLSTLFADISDHLREVLSDLIGIITRKMTPEIASYLGLITGTAQSTQVKTLWIVRAFSSLARSPVDADAAVPMTKNEVRDALQPLLQYLSTNLETFAEALYPMLFQRVLFEIWTIVVESISAMAMPGMEEKLCGSIKSVTSLSARQSSAFALSLDEIHSFFYANKDGIPLNRLDSDAYRSLKSVLEWYNLPTSSLIRQFVECEARASQNALVQGKGDLQLDLSLVLKGAGAILSVTVIDASGLVSKDPTSLPNPVVELDVVPRQMSQQVLHHCKVMRTKTKRRTRSPVFDETFTFNIEKWDPMLVLQVSVFESDLICGDEFIGDVAIQLSELPDGPSGRECVLGV
ncbi:hypothetical protein CAOG_005767 [Capsaspora owczarzaki ATCC 30864]|uniref:Uncharacterized protein n=1 Tax=Capsaspora owczarzaki (strain ATCC 30864) TaxID=595528 RepID=A0A0D2X422_CAPO3|nr:hypothetical protein CAOG_005767 [Capsaspora owczarzaki ATCC 30864]